MSRINYLLDLLPIILAFLHLNLSVCDNFLCLPFLLLLLPLLLPLLLSSLLSLVLIQPLLLPEVVH